MKPKTLSPVAVKGIFREYNEIYGVSKGFKRFINEIIAEDDRKNLINNIKVRKIGKNPNKELKYKASSEDKKINFLFKIRNMFTHTGASYASPGGGIFEDDGKSMIIDGKEMWGYQPIYYIHKSDFYYEYSVRRWPQLLIEIVHNTIRNNEENT